MARDKILLIDDDEPSRLGMEEYLTHYGYLVDCAGTRDVARRLGSAPHLWIPFAAPVVYPEF